MFNQPNDRLPFSDCFGTKLNSVWFQKKSKNSKYNLVWVDVTRSRGRFISVHRLLRHSGCQLILNRRLNGQRQSSADITNETEEGLFVFSKNYCFRQRIQLLSTTYFLRQHIAFDNILLTTTYCLPQHIAFDNVLLTTTYCLPQHIAFDNVFNCFQQHISQDNILL